MDKYPRRWKGRLLEDNFQALRLALTNCVSPAEVSELIRLICCWQPGEREEYLGLLDSLMFNTDSFDNFGTKINTHYDQSKIDEITWEIKCLGNPPKLQQGLGLFLKQYAN